jgi:hypothetical protein
MWRFLSHFRLMVPATAVAALVTCASPAQAAEHDVVFPAGEACDFELAVDSVGGDRVERTFVDRDGNPVRVLSAGVGAQTTWTNLSSGATLALPANGAVITTVFNSGGLQTWTLTGHVVLILFPTDVPAGPSTTLHIGRVVYTVDTTTGVFTVQSTSGRAIDICAALS